MSSISGSAVVRIAISFEPNSRAPMMSKTVSILALALFLQQLPAPFQTSWYRKITRSVPMPDGRQLTVAAGFNVSLFADKLEHPRWMALAPNGDVFVAESGSNKITVLRDADKDGVAELRETFAATGLNRPFGLAFWKNY